MEEVRTLKALKGDTPFSTMLMMMDAGGLSQWVWAYIDACSRWGVFHCDVDYCLLARPVDSSTHIDALNALADIEWEKDLPLWQFAHKKDAWHVIFAAGDIKKIFELALPPLPKLIWQRNGRNPVKVHNFQQIKEQIYAIRTKDTKDTTINPDC